MPNQKKNKNDRNLLAAGVLALLPGVSTAADPFVAPKDSVPKAGEPAGYVCGSFSQQRSGQNRVVAIGPKIWMSFQREGGQELGKIAYEQRAFGVEMRTPELHMASFCGALIPGRYRLIRGELEFLGAAAVVGGAVYSQGNTQKTFPIVGGEITVVAGETIYIGNFHQYSIDRYTYYVVVSDQFDRDLPYLRKKFPKVPLEQMRREIVGVEANSEGFQFLREPDRQDQNEG
jgi:hypothetical protein